VNEYVLIADDNVDARQIFSEAAESMGLVVETAADGTSALAMATQKPPTLILLDVMMPGLNGLQVLSRLRTHSATRNIPVLIITASGVGSVDPARLPGNTRVMQKASYNLGELMKVIGQMIGMEERAEEGQPAVS
jgi:CheY-like chemotaxis protein